MLNDQGWTRVQNRLSLKSINDYIITDKALMVDSSDVFVNKNGISSSDHYLLWFELGMNLGKSRKKARAFCINGEKIDYKIKK